MQSFQENQYPGGFLHSILPFPPPSTPTSASTAISVLPPQRAHPLTPGSSKERSFIEYVDRRLVDISGRYENRHNVGTLEDEDRTTKATGYESFEKLAVDLESVIDVIWVSGTPSLQIPCLLNVALAVSTYLPSFEFAPRCTFRLLQKLDVAFSSLLHGQNVESGETLPGFDGGRGKLTTTEKVRIRGLVERTRVAVVLVASKDGSVDSASKITETDEGTAHDDTVMAGIEEDDSDRRWEMDVARVYDRTIVDLGVALDTNNHVGYGW